MRRAVKWVAMAVTVLVADCAWTLARSPAVAQSDEPPLFQVEGVLEPGDEVLPDDGSLFDAHPFEGQAGQTVTIVMHSAEFDTYLLLLGPDDTLLMQNDDSGGSTDAAIALTLPQDGTYTIIANGYDPASQGAYTLTVSAIQPEDLPTEPDSTAQQVELFTRFQQGIRLLDTGQMEAAQELFQDILDRTRELDFPIGEAYALNGLGRVNDGIGNYALAIEQFDESIQIFQDPAIRRTAPQLSLQGEIIALGNLGGVYVARGQYQNALELYQRALSLNTEFNDAEMEGTILSGIGLVQSYRGNTPQAVETFEQALAILTELGDRQRQSTVLNNLGLAYASLGEYPRALGLLEQALDIGVELGFRELEATTLMNIGIVTMNQGNYPAALEAQQQSIAISQESGDRDTESIALNNMGQVFALVGDYGRAMDIYHDALAISRELGSRAVEGTILNNMGHVNIAIAQYRKAQDAYEEAMAIHQETGYLSGEAISLVGMATVYDRLGLYLQALEPLDRALDLFRTMGIPAGEAATLNNIGILQNRLGQFDEARDYLQRALTIRTDIGDRQGQGQSYNSLGILYTSLNEPEQALDAFLQGLAISQEIGDRFIEGNILNNIGLTYMTLEQPDQALAFYQQSLDISQSTGDPYTEGITLSNIGLIHLREGQYADAEVAILASIEVLEGLIDSDLDDEAQVSLFDTQVNNYEALQHVLIAQGKEAIALEIAERGRARIMANLLAQQIATRSIQPITAASPDMEEIRRIARQQNATLVNYSLIYTPHILPSLYIWVVQPDGTLDFAEIPLGNDPLEPTFATPTAQVDDSFLASVALRGGAEPRSVDEDLNLPLVSDLRSALTTDDGGRPIRAGSEPMLGDRLQTFHQILIDPIAHLLPDDPDERVIIIPQGELFLVPFAALQRSDGEYLIERHTLLTAPSIQVLGLTDDLNANLPLSSELAPSDVLIVGNPTMPSVWNQDKAAMEPLSPLAGSEDEARAIATLLNTQPLLGDAASEPEVRQRMETAKLIHLATHGLLQYGSPQDSGVRDVPGAIALAPSPSGTPDQRDGLLTSAELLTMTLQADLVVLSACDTGRGVITGDGVVGLSRSLMAAGVPSIIVSLWKVDDIATAELMEEFYRRWQAAAEDTDKAQALRQAMLDTMERYPDPRLWAAFTLIGSAD